MKAMPVLIMGQYLFGITIRKQKKQASDWSLSDYSNWQGSGLVLLQCFMYLVHRCDMLVHLSSNTVYVNPNKM